MKKFIKENKWQLITAFVIGLLAYIIKLSTYSISIDTEILINDPKYQINSWISINRWGLTMTKELFHLIPINIYLTNICAFIIFFISVAVWFANLDRLPKKKDNKIAKLIFGLVIITTPILAEQFYFSLQSVEIALAFLGISIAVYLQSKWIDGSKFWVAIPAILLVTYSFGCYQAFVPLFITICLFDYICRYDGKIEIKRIIKYLSIFVISFILNIIIDKLFKYFKGIDSTNYLSNQIFWGTERKLFTIDRVIRSVWGSFIGTGVHETVSYGILFILMTLVLNESKNLKNNKFFYLVYIVFFAVIPFITTIIKGFPEVARAKFAIPFVTGFALYYILLNSDRKEILNMTKIVAVYVIIVQTVTTFMLFYSDYNRYKEDVEVAKKIKRDFEGHNSARKPIFFVGKYKSKNVKLKGEALGESFFAHDSNTVVGCSFRAVTFMRTLGIEVNFFMTPELAPKAREELSQKIKNHEVDLKKYPEEGYIAEFDDYIVVNF